MKFTQKLRKTSFLWLGALLCALLLAGYAIAEDTGADNGQTKKTHKKIDKNFINPVPVTLTALVMEVHKDDFIIIIAEKYFYVAKFKVNGETYQTELYDTAGGKVEMNAFNKGDRVKVTAIELEPGKRLYVAQKIELLPPRKP